MCDLVKVQCSKPAGYVLQTIGWWYMNIAASAAASAAVVIAAWHCIGDGCSR